ncbi:MAG: helix-turn-helix transcriptional regulator [Clostridia bacterium]|nr:helix-turn-helix transcriptional regulator [Clostridia bacterium]
MIDCSRDIMCGIFDSSVNMRSKSRSDPRRVLYYELELFTDSTGICYVDEIPYPIKRGMLLCSHPGQLRHSTLPIRCHYIRLRATDGEEAEIISHFPQCSTVAEADIDKLAGLFLKLATAMIADIDKLTRDMRINSIFWDILYHARRSTTASKALPDNTAGTVTVMKAKEFIEDNFRGACTLSVIAEHVHVSPNHLHTVFKKKMGVSPLGYVHELRIDAAKQRIMAENGSLLEIALELGFSSQSHFNKVFRQSVGITPAEYRKQLNREY